MPKINTKVAESVPDLSEDGEYQIMSVDEVDTQQNHWKGLRATCKDAEGIEYAAMLWYPRDMSKGTADYSKLGCFISALGDDTDTWKGKYIRVESWKSKNNEVRVIEGFTSKKTKKPTQKDADETEE
jgi:hypothetical protein